MSLVEALSAIQLLIDMAPLRRAKLSRGLVRYFFLNAVEIGSCPFLGGNSCLIYDNRFFGCRAYGLWSGQYYEEQAEHSREAKRMSQTLWQGLGVSLPQEVVEFSVPYCPHVELEENGSVNDRRLLEILNTVGAISGLLTPWHELFRERYFSDLSFLLASLTLGMDEAIQLKFEIVRDMLARGKRDRLMEVVEELPDFCAGFE
jgi:Fe-S-cluster containining protein